MDTSPKQRIMDQGWMMRVLGYVTTPMQKKFLKPNEDKKMCYTRTLDFEMPVTQQTTVRDIKNFAMARHPSLHYYQLSIEFFAKPQKDAYTLKDINDQDNILNVVNCVYLMITIPNKQFKDAYALFHNLGMTEEKALEETKNFVDNVNKKTNYKVELLMYIKEHKLFSKHNCIR